MSSVDLARMRAERRERVVAGMADDGVDVLLLGTGANIRYATGATPLWLAGTRPFAPLAVVHADGTHLVANSDDGVPPEVPPDHLVRASWNPLLLMERLAGLGVVGGTVGVDGLSPMFEGLLTTTFPDARLVDATPLLHRARATKTVDELGCLRTAVAAAAGGLPADPVGRTERELHAAFAEHLAANGTTIPAFDPTFCVVDDGIRRLVSDRRVGEGDRVAMDVGAMVHGYEGGLARTWGAADDLLDPVLARCRPGVTLDELAAAAPASPLPVAYGVGLGVEPLAIDVGSTLCVQAFVDGVLVRDTVLLTADGAEVLTR